MILDKDQSPMKKEIPCFAEQVKLINSSWPLEEKINITIIIIIIFFFSHVAFFWPLKIRQGYGPLSGSRDKAFYCQDNLTNTIYIMTIGWCYPASTPKNITLYCAVCHAHFLFEIQKLIKLHGCSDRHQCSTFNTIKKFPMLRIHNNQKIINT